MAPDVREVIFLPALVNGEERKVIALWLVEPCLLLVRNLLSVLGAVEDIGFGEHGYDSDDFIDAGEVDSSEEHLGLWGFERELGHLASDFGEQPFVIERTERI